MQVLHELPGRIRLFVPGLWRKEDGIILLVYLKALDGIIQCDLNQRRSSILIIYDIQRIHMSQIMLQMDTIMEYLQTTEASQKHRLINKIKDYSVELKTCQTGAARKVIGFSMVYLLYKWKQARFGKFALSRSVPWLQVSSLVTIVGGYPWLKGLYKKYTRELPGDSEDILKQSSVFFTLVRESAKGVFVLALKTLNDWIKFSADLNNNRLWQQRRGDVCRLYIVLDQNAPTMLLTAEEVKAGYKLWLATGQLVPADASISAGAAFIAEADRTRLCQTGSLIRAGCIVTEGQLKLNLLTDNQTRERVLLPLDDVHQPETPYQRRITQAALSGTVLSYLYTGSSLSAIAVLLLMSPSAGNAAVSSGLNNCVYRLNRQNVLVPDPNRLSEISECQNLVIDQDLFREEIAGPMGRNYVHNIISKLEDLELKVSILVKQEAPEDPVLRNTNQICRDDLYNLPGNIILVGGAARGEELPSVYTILFNTYSTNIRGDILVFDRKLRDLPDILKEIRYARKVINQSVLFTKVFNIWYGVNAILQPFDAFAAKSLNTTNSLVALFSNQRILAQK